MVSGYLKMNIDDTRVIDDFEKEVARYAGSKYGVSVSSGSNAIFLSLQYLKYIGKLKDGDEVIIPRRTYISVAMSLINSGLKIKFKNKVWSGAYELEPTGIYDSAVRFTKDMYIPDSLYCLSFQYRKHLSIGRGGMILTDSKYNYDKLKQFRRDGRHEGISQHEDVYQVPGWNMYMLPEQAARGLTLMTLLPEVNEDIGGSKDYPDICLQIRRYL